jgi:hypothetical protein
MASAAVQRNAPSPRAGSERELEHQQQQRHELRQSQIFPRWRPSMRVFSDLMSRWITHRRCRHWRPSATSEAVRERFVGVSRNRVQEGAVLHAFRHDVETCVIRVADQRQERRVWKNGRRRDLAPELLELGLRKCLVTENLDGNLLAGRLDKAEHDGTGKIFPNLLLEIKIVRMQDTIQARRNVRDRDVHRILSTDCKAEARRNKGDCTRFVERDFLTLGLTDRPLELVCGGERASLSVDPTHWNQS